MFLQMHIYNLSYIYNVYNIHIHARIHYRLQQISAIFRNYSIIIFISACYIYLFVSNHIGQEIDYNNRIFHTDMRYYFI